MTGRDATACTCGNDLAGDNLCMVSACQWEGTEGRETTPEDDPVCSTCGQGDGVALTAGRCYACVSLGRQATTCGSPHPDGQQPSCQRASGHDGRHYAFRDCQPGETHDRWSAGRMTTRSTTDEEGTT